MSELGWEPLEDRRKKARLTMMYKISNNLIGINKKDQLPSVEPGNPTATTSSQSMPDSTHTKYSCFPRTIHEWNDLQDTSVMASAAEDFKVSLCN